ncbi:MAG: hypothetical protein U0X20_32105, partial [Caldilineaceae bacterium]
SSLRWWRLFYLATRRSDARLPDMLDGVYGDLPPRLARALRLIDGSGRHLLALINGLLDLSKVEAGKLALEIEAIVPDDTCRVSMIKPSPL